MHATLCIVAPAQWAGSLGPLPVEGRAWFLATGARFKKSTDLRDAYEAAACIYPTIADAIERVDVNNKESTSIKLLLRKLEVYEEDISHSGMGSIRASLDRRAQICGMRIVAAINAIHDGVVVHGMPLDRPLNDMPVDKVKSMAEELVFMEKIPGTHTKQISSQRL